jgi:hypothetical protein
MDLQMGQHRHDQEEDADLLLIQVGRTILDNAPALLFGSALLLAAAWPGLFLASGASWAIAWPALMLCTGPVWTGVVAMAGQLLEGDAVTARGLLGLLRRHAGAGFRIALLPAVVGGILFGAIELLDRNPDARWLAVPLLLDAGAVIVTVTSLVSVFSLTVMRGLTGIDLWLTSAAVTISRPVPVLGTVTLFGIVGWLALAFGPAALVLLGPLAVLAAAVTREALPGAPG